jgi:hypothetical protein
MVERFSDRTGQPTRPSCDSLAAPAKERPLAHFPQEGVRQQVLRVGSRANRSVFSVGFSATACSADHPLAFAFSHWQDWVG